MNQNTLVDELFNLRHQLGEPFALQKRDLLEKINPETLRSKKAITTFYDTLLFIMAYPDNKKLYEQAELALHKLGTAIEANENLRSQLYNSGITGSQLCADFGFEIVKWLRQTYKQNVTLDSFAAPDYQILSILSVVMPQVESEILQDENSTWKEWLKKCTVKGEDLLDTLITLFNQSTIRPEVKDELWTALGIYITINLTEPVQLPASLTKIHYHRSLIKKASLKDNGEKFEKVKLKKEEAEKIFECARVILACYLREIDPISFSDWEGVSYYQLPRGMSIALFGMRPERRHPIDSYMGYMVFKNGLPFGYAGSWVLFDSARIGLNIFPSFRGGESQHTFEQILKLHKQAYRLNRFSADPYQIGKHNSDGIKSGAFWLYYKMGFRPIKEEQKQLAAEEDQKRQTIKGYRSSAAVLNKLADSRLELTVDKKKPVRFDATDLSLLYATIVNKKYGGNRRKAEQESYRELTETMGLNVFDETFRYVMGNWSVILMSNSTALLKNKPVLKALETAFILKSVGREEDYMQELQQSALLRRFIEETYFQYFQ